MTVQRDETAQPGDVEGPRKKEKLGHYVEPEERAARLVRQLDEYLRKGPKRGLNYTKWQHLAFYELVDELKRAEMAQQKQDGLVKTSMISLAVGLGTIAFWAATVFFGQRFGLLGAALIVIAGYWVWRNLKTGRWIS